MPAPVNKVVRPSPLRRKSTRSSTLLTKGMKGAGGWAPLMRPGTRISPSLGTPDRIVAVERRARSSRDEVAEDGERSVIGWTRRVATCRRAEREVVVVQQAQRGTDRARARCDDDDEEKARCSWSSSLRSCTAKQPDQHPHPPTDTFQKLPWCALVFRCRPRPPRRAFASTTRSLDSRPAAQ